MSKEKRGNLSPEETMAIDSNDEFYEEMTARWILSGSLREMFGVATLFFECEHCGLCCTTFDDVAISDVEIERLSLSLGISVSEFREKYTRTASQRGADYSAEELGDKSLLVPCPFHTDNGCSVYDQRPKACVAFPCFTSLQTDPLTGEKRIDDTCKALRKALEFVKNNQKAAIRKEGEFLDRVVG